MFSSCGKLLCAAIPRSVASIDDSAFNRARSQNMVIITAEGAYAETYGIRHNFPVFYTFNTLLEIDLPAEQQTDQFLGAKVVLTDEATGRSASTPYTGKPSVTLIWARPGATYRAALVNQYGYAIASLNHIFIAALENHVTLPTLLETRRVTLQVMDPSDADITNQVQLKWYDADGVYLTAGSGIAWLPVGAHVQYETDLNSALGVKYQNVKRTTYTVTSGNNAIVAALEPRARHSRSTSPRSRSVSM